jgi:Uma2 family endonuclease
MTLAPPPKEITYPESDGNPIAENTLQFEWTALLHHGFSAMYADDPQVWVASDVLWYPIKGDNQARCAPDLLVAFGRPRRHRRSYEQWEEDNIAPQIVLEVTSSKERTRDLDLKFEFYRQHGVEEYYVYNVDTFDFSVWIKQEGALRPADFDHKDVFVSPRTGVQFFCVSGKPLVVFYPTGEPFQELTDEKRERLIVAYRLAEQAREKLAVMNALHREMEIEYAKAREAILVRASESGLLGTEKMTGRAS